MGLIDGIRRRRADKLLERGYDLIEDGADNPDEALGFVRALDTRGPAADWAIDTVEAMEPRPEDPKGVYRASGRVFYEGD